MVVLSQTLGNEISGSLAADFSYASRLLSDSEDSVLIQRTLDGEETAFAELIRRHQGSVWRTALRIMGKCADTEDAVQEIFFRAYKALRRFDTRRPFGPWVLRIATNYCIDQLRRRKLLQLRLWTELNEAERNRAMRDLSQSSESESLLVGDPEEYVKAAAGLLDELKPKYRRAFVLRELENRSYEEIAGLLGTSPLAARVRVSRARSEIRRKFAAYLRGTSAAWRSMRRFRN
jgi:RNA polymerase sigma-70 factor (ECF subfamily)